MQDIFSNRLEKIQLEIVLFWKLILKILEKKTIFQIQLVSAEVNSGSKDFLRFEPLSWVPIQTAIIDKSLLDEDQVKDFCGILDFA